MSKESNTNRFKRTGATSFSINIALAVFVAVLTMGSGAAHGASFIIDSLASITAPAAVFSQTIASDPVTGNNIDYIRIRNSNPGRDGNSGTAFTGGGNRRWVKKRRIRLTESIGATRNGEKVKVNLETIQIPYDNYRWEDLRLVDNGNTSIPFRLLYFESPQDNLTTPVTLLFHATATANANTDYWLYYGNPEATSVSDDSLNPFYLLNHDFENGITNWAEASTTNTWNGAAGRPITPVFGPEENLSILPPGFTGYSSKSCLSATYNYCLAAAAPNVANTWRTTGQIVIMPATGSMRLSAYYRVTTCGTDDTNRLRGMLRLQNENNTQVGFTTFTMPSSITDWVNIYTDLNNCNTATVSASLGMYYNADLSGSGWRERRVNYDWAVLDLKNPLAVTLGDEQPAGYYSVGSYTSEPMNTGVSNPIFKSLTWLANTTAPGTSVEFYTRTGATAGTVGPAWQGPFIVNGSGTTSPSNQWIQIRADLKTSDSGYTPYLDKIELFYQLPVASFSITAPSTVTAGEYFECTLKAIDALGAVVPNATGTVTFSAASGSVGFATSTHVFTTQESGISNFLTRIASAGTFVINASSGAIIGTSSSIICKANTTAQLRFSGIPAVATSGVTFTAQVRALDVYGNINTADSGDVAISCDDPYPASIPSSIQLSSGIGTLSNIALFTAPQRIIQAGDDNRGLLATVSVTVNASSVSGIQLITNPDQYRDTPFLLTGQMVDAFGNHVATEANPVNLGISSGTILPASFPAFVNGSASTMVTLNAEGNLTLLASDSATTPRQGNRGVFVHPPSYSGLDGFTLDCGNLQLAGVPFTLMVTARDGFGNLFTGYKGACRIRIASSTVPPFKPSQISTATPEFSTGYDFLDGELAIPLTVSGASDTIIIWVEDIQDSTKFSYISVKVRPSGLDRLEVLDTPASIVAGASVSYKVVARDAMNNIITNYTGTVGFSHTAQGGNPFIPPIYSFQVSDAGVHTFVGTAAARFTRAETVRIKAEDSGRVGFSQPIRVLPATSSPVITILPDQYTIKLRKPTSFGIDIKDIYGNPFYGFSGPLSLGIDGVLASVTQSYTLLDFENGFHRFPDALIPHEIGTLRILATETTSNTGGVSNDIFVISDQTVNFNIQPASVSVHAGDYLPVMQVTARDPADQVNKYYMGSLRFSATDTKALLPGESTLSDGTGFFSPIVFKTAGTYELSVRDVADPLIMGSMTVNVAASSPYALKVNVPAFNFTVGTPFVATVNVVDRYDNATACTSRAFSFYSTDTNPQAQLTTNTMFGGSLWTLNNRWFASAGAQILYATAPGLLTGQSPPLRVNAGAPASMSLSAPATVSAEVFAPFKVRILDSFGNPTPSYIGTVAVNLTAPPASTTLQAAPTATYTFPASQNGEHTFNLAWVANAAALPQPEWGIATFTDLNGLCVPAATSCRVFIDAPRTAGWQQSLSSFWVSNPRPIAPETEIIASVPFTLTILARTVRDTPAMFTSPLSFAISNGDFLVSNNVNGPWARTWNPGAATTTTLFGVVTRTGYLTLFVQGSADPTKSGTVTFTSKPGPLYKTTMLADSPQTAGATFPFVLEWWDYYGNYAETATRTLSLNASPTFTFPLTPSALLPGGRPGVLNTANDARWFDTKFWAASQTSSVSVDLPLQEIKVEGIYDQDFTDGSPLTRWTGTTVGAAGLTTSSGFDTTESILRIWHLGNGYIYNNTNWNRDVETNLSNPPTGNEGYYHLFLNTWNLADVQPFEAKVSIKRVWYDSVHRDHYDSVGLIFRTTQTNKNRFVAVHLQNSWGDTGTNMSKMAYGLYRSATGNNDVTYRVYQSNNNANLLTHPKWLRIQRTVANNNNYMTGYSSDGQNWINFDTYNGGALNPYNLQANFDNAGTAKTLGIFVAAGSTLYPGMGWIDKFEVDRFWQAGTYTTMIYDVGTPTATVGSLQLTTNKPAGTAINVFLRRSNNAATLGAAAWTNVGNADTINLAAHAGFRYYQFAFHLVAAGPVAGIFNRTPVLRDFTLPYTTANNSRGARFTTRRWENLIASFTGIASYIPALVEIQGGLVASLALTASPAASAGIPLSLSVTAFDAFGNIADNASGAWFFNTTDGAPYPGVVPATYTLTPTIDLGQHTFSSSAILKGGGNQKVATISVGAQPNTNNIATGNAVIQIDPGPLDHFVASASTPQKAVTNFPVYIRAEDAFENQKLDFTGTGSVLTFTDSHTGGMATYGPHPMPGTTWLGGCATLTPGARFTKSEKLRITTTGENRTGTTNEIFVLGATESSMIFNVAPTNYPMSGASFTLIVTVYDAYGNLAHDYNGELSFTCDDPDSRVVLPAPYTFVPTSDWGSHTWTMSSRLITPGPVNITAHGTGIASDIVYPLMVIPGEVAAFELFCTNPQTANVPFNLLVKAFDAYGHLKTNYSGAVTLGGSFDKIMPSAPVSGFSNGQLLIPSVQLDHATLPHTEYLIASFAAPGGGWVAVGSVSVNLLASSSDFDRFVVETIPTTLTAGDAFKLIIKAVGISGAVYTNFSPTVTVQLLASETGPIDPPMLPSSVTGFTSGVKEVYARIWEAGTIRIIASGAAKLGSATVTVLPTNLDHFELVPATSTVEPHPNHYYQVVNGTFSLTITGYDAIGNVKTDYSGNVIITHTGTGTLSVASATLTAGSATVQVYYDTPGTIRINGKDTALGKTGQSYDVDFFGKLATFVINCFPEQTNQQPFLTEVIAYDEYGQIKKSCLAELNPQDAGWTGTPGAVTLTPSPMTPTWFEGKAYPFFTADVPPSPPGTLTLKLTASPLGPSSASGTVDLLIRPPSAGPAVAFLLEAFSPQKIDEPFPLLVKAVDAANAVVTTWASDTLILATTTINPSFIPAAKFATGAGVYATTTAALAGEGTFRVIASSSGMIGSVTIVIEPGPLADLRVWGPPSAPLAPSLWSTPMYVVGLLKSGAVKSNYKPNGLMTLKVNVGSTGDLGVVSVDPSEFVGGMAVISAQTYDKSQVIRITAKDPHTGIASTSGPISVYGTAAKFTLEPMPSGKGTPADPLIYNNFFNLRLTVKDVNNFIVPDYAGQVSFQVLPGTAPTDLSPTLVTPIGSQAFLSTYNGVRDFAFKASPSAVLGDIYLRVSATDGAISKTSTDLLFRYIEVFDRFVITVPTDGQKRQKKLKFPFKVQAISNLNNLWNNASAPMISYALVDPVSGFTGFIATPTQWTPLAFGGSSEVATEVAITYDQSSTATYRISIDSGGLAEASVTVKLMLGDPEFRNAENIILEANATYVVSVFARTLDKSLATGTGYIKVKLYDDEASGTAVMLYAPDGSSDVLGTTVGHHGWQRYWWYFTTGATATQAAVVLSVGDGVVYYDAVMLEKAPRANILAPSAYTPHPFTFSHPASESTFDIGGKGQYWQW